MAETILQFLDLAGTRELKNQLVQYIDKQDAHSIKGVGINGKTLKFYKTLPIEGATAAYEVPLPETDLSHVMNLVTSAVQDDIAVFGVGGQVKDSGKKLSDFYIKTEVDNLIGNLEGKINENTAAINTLDGAVTTRINAAKTELNNTITEKTDNLQGQVTAIKTTADGNATKIGNLDDLTTSQKGNIVAAIEEVKASVAAGGTDAVVTIEESTSDSNYAKVYTFKQAGAKIGSVNIPKDMVVESGEVVTNPTGHPAGTYIKLTLANAEETELFINVGALVDIYKAKGDAAQVQVEIDSTTREISAYIVAGSIGSDEIADNAILTRHIADGNVTKAKLSTSVQESLTKADNSATQIALDAEAERAKKAESDLDERIDELEKNVTGNVADMITQAKDDAIDHADSEIAKVKATIGTVPEGKTVVGMIEEATYDDTAIQASVAANTKSITDLSGTHTADKQALQNQITANADAITILNGSENVTGSVYNKINEKVQAIPVSTITGLFA